MNPYYYVFRVGTGNPPIVRHATIEAAQTEAERLAQKHKGAHFEILKAVAISHVPKPAITFFMDEDAPNQWCSFNHSVYPSCFDPI